MEKINNPFDNHCFGCSPNNPVGLKMEFYYDPENQGLVSHWEPDNSYEGYPNVLHGGIQSLMVDEIAAWSVYVLAETAGVTKSMAMDFQKPVFLHKGKISLHCRLKSITKRVAVFEIDLSDGENNICTQGVAEYFVYPQKIARKKFDYPGLSAFLPKK